MKGLSIPSIFGDNAVFAKGLPISVFGESQVEGDVVLTLANGESYAAHFVPENDRFFVALPSVQYYTDGATLTVTAGEDTYEARNISIGIVLLAAGQSNMEMRLNEAERPFSLYPSEKMRFFTEKHDIGSRGGLMSKPTSDRWYTADGMTELNFSAIGYFTAQRLSSELGATVGVVSCNQGASRIEAWMSPEAVKKSGCALPTPEVVAREHVFNLDNWLYYNKYLNVGAYTYTAVLWYQGENNTGVGEGECYARLLHELICEWRNNNPNKQLPFYLVELAPLDTVRSGWSSEPIIAFALVRLALSSAPRTESGVYTVSLTEVPDATNIHPTNKHEVACKLSNAILTTLYGYDLEYTGPTLLYSKRNEDILTIAFEHAEGLAFLDKNRNEAAPRDAFFILENGARKEAILSICDNCVCAEIPQGATQFTMGYSDLPRHNLYNSSGYLASPFCILL